MSSLGSILDAVGQIAVIQVASLDAANVERGIRERSEVADGSFPHAFLTASGDAPIRTVELLEDLQTRTTTTFSVLYWTLGATQEQTISDAEAIVSGIAADPTLGGLVRWSLVTEVTLGEHRGEPERVVELVVVAVEEA